MEALREPPTLSPPVEAYISADEFWDMSNSPEYADTNCELVEGRIVEMSRPGAVHGFVTARLGVKLGIHVERYGLGAIFSNDVGFVLRRNPIGSDTVRGIDVAFVSSARLPHPIPIGWIEGPPDLAVEVLSPGNLASDINLKTRQLLDAGAQAVWIVDPATRSVQIHSPQGFTVLREGDGLSGGDILPGFSIKVADIFPA